MTRVIIGTYAERYEDGSFKPSVAITAEVEEVREPEEGEREYNPYPFDHLAEYFFDKIREIRRDQRKRGVR